MHRNIQLSRLLLAGVAAAGAATLLTGVAVSAVNNSWTTVAPMPAGGRANIGAATGPDGLIYAMGGYNGVDLDRMEAYSAASNTWLSEPPMPGGPRSDVGAATGPDGLVYVIGGVDGSTFLSRVEAFDTTTNTWTTEASMPGGGRLRVGTATGPDGRIYAIGGRDTTGDLNRVEAYDTTTNTWTTVAPMPGGAREGMAVATGPDGRIYAIGGYDGTNVLSRVEAYDTATNTWTTLAPLPGGPREGAAAALGPDGRIYVIGGDDSNVTEYSRVEAYNTTSNTWTTAQPLAAGPRTFTGAATGPDGRIYAIGGYPGGPFTALTEAYTTIGGVLHSTGTIISATEGSSFSGVAVATFSDADQNTTPSTYSATINWGDTSSSAGIVGGNNANGFTVTGGHTYAEEGSYTVTVQISDLDGNSVTATGSASTADAALSAGGLKLRQSNDRVNGVIANFTDADPGGLASDYTATISWGDGTSSAGIVSSSGGGFSVSGTHTYLRDRERATIKVTIRDAGASEAIAVTTARE
jgi:N-acetylneuraminic acid mutarotase